MDVSTTKITYARQGDVAVIRLDDPATMNAIDLEAGEFLTAAIGRASGEARCIVLAGSERAFCSGANLSGRGGNEALQRDVGASLEAVFNPMMHAIRDCAIPVVSAVRGAAAGIGASIALAADIIVAGESAYFLQAFRRIGLVPDGGSPFLLVKSIGRVRAMELMLLGDKLPARKAEDWGLITRVVADDAVENTAFEMAASLAKGPTRALGMIRRMAWTAAESSWNDELALERELQREAGHTSDFMEGVSAFLAKREAQFTGN